MSIYTIVKSRPKRYHKKVIKFAFDVLEKYHKELLRYCAEMPYLPLHKDEIFSDLIIDRMPRFVVNYRTHTLEELQEMIVTDFSAVTDRKKYKINQDALTKKLNVLQAKIEGRRKANGQKYKLNEDRLKEQLQHFTHLKKLAGVEKNLLAYLRSCVRRTKIKYLQQLRGTTANKTTHNADPTNGMLEIADTITGLDVAAPEHALEILKRIDLMPEDQDILMQILIFDKTFPDLGEHLGCSRSTAARRYQNAFHNMIRLVKQKNITLEDLLHV